ncbi:MAG: phospholipase D-like domain-containing protein, partial [Firmicutes bacterium]|nr:phospholipase D-like domain-containing protein [Bacillota bacterium]
MSGKSRFHSASPDETAAAVVARKSSWRSRRRALALAGALATTLAMVGLPPMGALAQAANTAQASASAAPSGFPTVQATTGTRLLIEPAAGPTPIDDAIDAAKQSIDVEMYLITDHQVERALIAAANRGVKVRVILDRTPEGLVSDAVSADQLLAQNGIAVRYAPSRFTFEHSK